MKKRTGRALSFGILILILICSEALAQEAISLVVNKVIPSVVLIATFDEDRDLQGLGTGFFVAPSEIITNYHVVENADLLLIKTSNGDLFEVKEILSADREWDLVRLLIELEGKKFTALSLAPEESLAIGQTVIVVGNPFGLEATVSTGIISGLRQIKSNRVIQMTAPVSPGSSGSPVVDLKGRVLGVATVSLSVGQNLNFAMPVEKILGLIPKGDRKPTPPIAELFKKDDIIEKAKSVPKRIETEEEENQDTGVNKSLEDTLVDIRKKAAIDEIQKRIASREAEESDLGRQLSEPPAGAGREVDGARAEAAKGTSSGSGPFTRSGPGTKSELALAKDPGSGRSSITDMYYSTVYAKIRREWSLPEDIPGGMVGLEAIIVLVIDKDGKVQKTLFEKRSGNGLYDQMALRAIRKAEPFPPPPKEVGDCPCEIGIRFYPE